ncbi:MAG: TIGR01777 family protein [Desulfobacterales bacterium]|nr:TIGR01777 family protein [Desulfobacterales bacterium]
MSNSLFVKQVSIPAPLSQVFDWHCREGALLRLTPPWEHIQVLKQSGIQNGAETEFRIWTAGLPIRWKALHQNYIHNQVFEDIQLKGPFAHWHHQHLFKSEKENVCSLEDRIQYKLKGGFWGNLAGNAFIQQKLDHMFRYRHHVLHTDFSRKHQLFHPLKLIISGSRGQIGSFIIPYLNTQGHTIKCLVRNMSIQSENELYWTSSSEKLADAFQDTDVVIHLAGEPIGEGRWNAEKKKRIVDSRVQGTHGIAKALALMNKPPKTFISASAIGYYGNRANDWLEEKEASGSDFISYVCSEWEKAARPAIEKGIRVIFLRIGIVLTPKGGALGRLLLPYKAGLGNIIGNGDQYISWLSMNELPYILDHLIFTENIDGPVNLVSPNPVQQKEFANILAQSLGRTVHFTMSDRIILRMFGQMGKEILLSSTRVYPKKLLESGYVFSYPILNQALSYLV